MKRAESIVKRLVLGAFVAAAVVCGGGKHPQTVGRVAPNRPDDVLATKDAKSTKEDVPLRSLWSLWPSNWNRRGAWRDSFRFDFADGWVFPWGSNHLASVEVVSWGEAWPAWNDTNAIARLGVPVSIVPGLTTFATEYTPSNSYRFAWTDAAANRDTNTLITAAIELFRSGDWCVTTNGAARWGQRALPFPHDGYGQDAEWVAANFTNAAEILQQGYAAWVDAQVGEGLTNGLYKLTVAVNCDPPETTLVTVGDYAIAVTNAGAYVFLLEKGPDYDIAVFPPNTNITLSAADDVPLLHEETGLTGLKKDLQDSAQALAGNPVNQNGNPVNSVFAGGAGAGGWIADGGAFGTDYAPGCATGRVWWLPWLCGSPDMPHLYPDGSGVTLEVVLADYCWTGGASFHWTASPGLSLATPDAPTTELTATNAPSWAAAHLSVTATFDGDHSLASYTEGLTYGTNDAPQVHISLNVPHVWVNAPASTNNLRAASVRFSSDAPTNGTLTVSFEGNSEHLHMAQSNWTFPIDEAMSSGQTWELGTIEGLEACSSVGEERFSWTFTPEVGEAVGGEARTTVARVLEVDLWSAKGGASANPPPFEGQTTCDFSVMKSPNPDRHYPVFFKDVVDDGLSVAPYEVEYRVTTQPGGFSVSGGRTELVRLDGPESGTLRGTAGKTAYFDTPSEGGVYKIGVAYADSPMTETILVLPLAGASIDAVFDEDMIALDVIMSRLGANTPWWEKQTPDFGNKWFYNANVMDYLGRTDNVKMRTVWCYNQVSDDMFSDGFRMGAVATFRGIPTRLTKLGNFMAGYGTKRINVLELLRIFSQLKGTRNDTTANMSWDAGTDVANGSNLVERTAMLATNMWFVADVKERNLWPNPTAADNHLETKRDFDYNRYFVSPGAVQTSRRWVMSAQ